MGLFNRDESSKNWDLIRKQKFKDQAKNRDVHTTQDMERGERGELDSKLKYHIGAVFVGLLFSGIGYAVGCVGLIFWGLVDFIQTHQGESFLKFKMSSVDITGDWKIYAWTAFVFLMAWLIADQRFMILWRSRNSMIDSTDINTYENDQHIMLPEEIQRSYDWFPDAGAHSSVQVSSMLSHMMISKKGLKMVDVVKRHKKDVKDENGNIIFYKGEPVLDEHGNPVKEKLPIIDEEFGQDLYTASGIPVSEKDTRTPYDVRKIEYNPKDETGNRKDRDKLDYDTVADLINNDWEFPEYEVQRPAGAYIVDTAPVNTMVLAITRAGKGSLARFV